VAEAQSASGGSGPADIGLTDRDGNGVFGGALYGTDEVTAAPEAAVSASLGCGVPTAVADLHEGEIVLDLGRARERTFSSAPSAWDGPARPSALT